jgi:hypothetical protein
LKIGDRAFLKRKSVVENKEVGRKRYGRKYLFCHLKLYWGAYGELSTRKLKTRIRIETTLGLA